MYKWVICKIQYTIFSVDDFRTLTRILLHPTDTNSWRGKKKKKKVTETDLDSSMSSIYMFLNELLKLSPLPSHFISAFHKLSNYCTNTTNRLEQDMFLR